MGEKWGDADETIRDVQKRACDNRKQGSDVTYSLTMRQRKRLVGGTPLNLQILIFVLGDNERGFMRPDCVHIATYRR